MCAFKGTINIGFSRNLAYVLSEWSLRQKALGFILVNKRCRLREWEVSYRSWVQGG